MVVAKTVAQGRIPVLLCGAYGERLVALWGAEDAIVFPSIFRLAIRFYELAPMWQAIGGGSVEQ